MFANLTQPTEKVKEVKDVVGGGNFGPLETGIYPAKVTMAYTGKSSGGAATVTIHLKTPKRELRETVYVSSGDAKGNAITFKNKDGELEYLPGYALIESLCNLTVGKYLQEVDTEAKVIKLWDRDAKKELPTEQQVAVELLDQEVYVAVEKQIVDKNVKSTDAAGKVIYVPSGETREVNEIVKFFRASDKMTMTELKAGKEKAEFYNTWVEQNAGKTRDKSTKQANGTVGAPVPIAAAPAAGTARPSLFG